MNERAPPHRERQMIATTIARESHRIIDANVGPRKTWNTKGKVVDAALRLLEVALEGQGVLSQREVERLLIRAEDAIRAQLGVKAS